MQSTTVAVRRTLCASAGRRALTTSSFAVRRAVALDRALANFIATRIVYDGRYEPEFLQVAVTCCHTAADMKRIYESVKEWLPKAPMTHFAARIFLVMFARHGAVGYALDIVDAYGKTTGDPRKAYSQLSHLLVRCCQTPAHVWMVRQRMQHVFQSTEGGGAAPTPLMLCITAEAALLAQQLTVKSHSTDPSMTVKLLSGHVNFGNAAFAQALSAVCARSRVPHPLVSPGQDAKACCLRAEIKDDAVNAGSPHHVPCITCRAYKVAFDSSSTSVRGLWSALPLPLSAKGLQSLSLQGYRAHVRTAVAVALSAESQGDSAAGVHALTLAVSLVRCVTSPSPPAPLHHTRHSLDPVTLTALAYALLACMHKSVAAAAVLELFHSELSVRPWMSDLELSALLSPSMLSGKASEQGALKLQARVVALIRRAEQAVCLPPDMLAEVLNEGGEESVVHSSAGSTMGVVMSLYGDMSVEAAVEAVGVQAHAQRKGSFQLHDLKRVRSMEEYAEGYLAGPPSALPSAASLAMTPPLYTPPLGRDGTVSSAALPTPGSVEIFDDIVLDPRSDTDLDTLLEVRARLQIRGGLSADQTADAKLPAVFQDRNPYAIAVDALGLQLLKGLLALKGRSPMRHILSDSPETTGMAMSILRGLRYGLGRAPPVEAVRGGTAPGQGGPLVMATGTAALAASDREVSALLRRIKEEGDAPEGDGAVGGAPPPPPPCPPASPLSHPATIAVTLHKDPMVDELESGMRVLLANGAVIDAAGVLFSLLQRKKALIEMLSGNVGGAGAQGAHSPGAEPPASDLPGERIAYLAAPHIQALMAASCTCARVLREAADRVDAAVERGVFAQATILQARVGFASEEDAERARAASATVQGYAALVSASLVSAPGEEEVSSAVAEVSAIRADGEAFLSDLLDSAGLRRDTATGAYVMRRVQEAVAAPRRRDGGGRRGQAPGGAGAAQPLCAGGKSPPTPWAVTTDALVTTSHALRDLATKFDDGAGGLATLLGATAVLHAQEGDRCALAARWSRAEHRPLGALGAYVDALHAIQDDDRRVLPARLWEDVVLTLATEASRWATGAESSAPARASTGEDAGRTTPPLPPSSTWVGSMVDAVRALLGGRRAAAEPPPRGGSAATVSVEEAGGAPSWWEEERYTAHYPLVHMEPTMKARFKLRGVALSDDEMRAIVSGLAHKRGRDKLWAVRQAMHEAASLLRCHTGTRADAGLSSVSKADLARAWLIMAVEVAADAAMFKHRLSEEAVAAVRAACEGCPGVRAELGGEVASALHSVVEEGRGRGGGSGASTPARGHV